MMRQKFNWMIRLSYIYCRKVSSFITAVTRFWSWVRCRESSENIDLMYLYFRYVLLRRNYHCLDNRCKLFTAKHAIE